MLRDRDSRRLVLPLLAIGVVLCLSSLASKGEAQSRGTQGVVILEEATTYDFEDDLVSGDLVRPDGEMLNVRRRGRRSSLIRVRENFIPELLKSVENL